MFYKRNFIARITVLICLAASLTVALPAADKPDKGEATVAVTASFFHAGNEVKSGQYEVKWESSGSEATVLFIRHEKTAAKLQGKIVTVENKSEYDTLLTDKDSSGRTTIKELLLGGKSFKIVF